MSLNLAWLSLPSQTFPRRATILPSQLECFRTNSKHRVWVQTEQIKILSLLNKPFLKDGKFPEKTSTLDVTFEVHVNHIQIAVAFLIIYLLITTIALFSVIHWPVHIQGTVLGVRHLFHISIEGLGHNFLVRCVWYPRHVTSQSISLVLCPCYRPSVHQRPCDGCRSCLTDSRFSVNLWFTLN